ncbi:RHS repeat domain-containing protein [Oleiagrimonas citrea]|nr:RHS repeat-associated core domain-containing protein [Oleiagrimonas citrea]
MQARYYDQMTGRFLSRDPLGSSPGGIFDFNRYAYAYNNPIVNMDPAGCGLVQAIACVMHLFHVAREMPILEGVERL